MKNIIILIALLLLASVSYAQIVNPAEWTYEVKNDSVLFKAEIKDGWHLYDIKLPEGGPKQTSIVFDSISGIELDGNLTSLHEPVKKYDRSFEMTLSWYKNKAEFAQKIKFINKKNYYIRGHIEYMACDDNSCVLPPAVSFVLSKGAKEIAVETGKIQSKPENPLWNPVTKNPEKKNGKEETNGSSWIIIFLSGFLGGILAIFTPCVWPVIPMTVSFFMRKATDRKKAIKDAVIYGTSIVAIYLLLGIGITIIFGASALNSLSTSAFFNLLFFVLFVGFALSFFGLFDIVLPSSWVNKLDRKADNSSGIMSIFFMAFTLVLVSFSCTGPIIGTLLVQAASMGSLTGPITGMAGFSIALAIPFFLFAIFPKMLSEIPKSGSFLHTFKVSIGFLELALSLKFFSIADLAYGWNILGRNTFIVLWIIIFIIMALFLLGIVKIPLKSKKEKPGITRIIFSAIIIAFTIYLGTGLSGRPVKFISAFAPPLKQEINTFNDFEEGMLYAARVNKPVLLDFSGYGCVNCRKMEDNVLHNKEVSKKISEKFVFITLMVDDKTKLPEPYKITEYGKTRTIKTAGDKWSYLQRYKFGANAQPYFVILDKYGNLLAGSYSYDTNIENFISFLESGLKNK